MSNESSRDYIELSKFLKLAGLVQSGGEAKQWVFDERVRVNGEIELRRRRKLRRGDRVAVDDVEIGVDEIVSLEAASGQAP
ncbi:MAG: RNA-binding S4 domain-containing protein [Caldilineae bacterium]|nr:RNA-binding S4 domain-containing protein [Chloroflexota bacterium]MCB9175560.1 RNA-binding S4 domain-containing protein [Caldilineae bacterium]